MIQITVGRAGTWQACNALLHIYMHMKVVEKEPKARIPKKVTESRGDGHFWYSPSLWLFPALPAGHRAGHRPGRFHWPREYNPHGPKIHCCQEVVQGFVTPAQGHLLKWWARRALSPKQSFRCRPRWWLSYKGAPWTGTGVPQHSLPSGVAA